MGYTAEYQSTLRKSIEQMKQQLINMYNERGVIDEGIIKYSQILDKKIVEFQRVMGNKS